MNAAQILTAFQNGTTIKSKAMTGIEFKQFLDELHSLLTKPSTN